MSDARQCPYCGEEMRFDADSCHVWMKCDACLSCSPKVEKPEWKSLYPLYPRYAEYQYRLRELAEEAASKRPLRKPMTLEEVNKCDRSVWVEFKTFSLANGWCSGVLEALHWGQKVYQDMRNPEFGVEYRLWAHKPTNEERKAAAWETKDDERSKD